MRPNRSHFVSTVRTPKEIDDEVCRFPSVSHYMCRFVPSSRTTRATACPPRAIRIQPMRGDLSCTRIHSVATEFSAMPRIKTMCLAGYRAPQADTFIFCEVPKAIAGRPAGQERYFSTSAAHDARPSAVEYSTSIPNRRSRPWPTIRPAGKCLPRCAGRRAVPRSGKSPRRFVRKRICYIHLIIRHIYLIIRYIYLII